MNWVGGSRSRYMKNKEDEIKQRAFFQKQRMKRKSNIVDSSKVQNSDNMDLLTLFIVNQIASKKEQTGKPKINSLNDPKSTKKSLNEPLKLPMSPCSPSKLNLGSSPPQNRVYAPSFKIRKHRLSEDFKFTPLSPVLESNLSDLSGSESQHQPCSSSAGSSDSVQPKPTAHVPSSQPSKENPDNMKKTPKYVSFSQPTKLDNPWTDASKEAPEQDLPHDSPLTGIQFESTLPNPKMGEDSVASVLYPLSSEQPEKPLFIDFKDVDCEVLTSMSSCDRSQNMDNAGHFSKQEFVCTNSNECADGRDVFMNICETPRRVYLGPDDEEKNDLRHAEDILIAKHCCLSGNSLIATPSQAPSSRQEAKSYCGCQSETDPQRRDGNPPRTLTLGTQTSALSYCDASVQCSLIHHSESVSFPTSDQKTNVLTTRRQSTLSPPKDGHKRTGKRGASAKKQQAQSQTGSIRKLRSQKSMQRDLMSILKHPFRKASEQKEKMCKARVKIERCDSKTLSRMSGVQENL